MTWTYRISYALLAVLCLPAVSCSSTTSDTVEELVDAHDRAWLANDAEAVGSLFTDDGVFIDLVGIETVGRQDIITYAEGHVTLIPESRRTGPIEVEEDGTYVVPTHLVVKDRGTYTGLIAVTVADNLLARYDLSELNRLEDS